jgi:hypothetical protein
MKCAVCSTKIPTTFLEKVLGAYVKDAKGKKHLVCSACQSTLGSKDKIVEKL